MNRFKKKYKKLWKAYNSRLSELHKVGLESMADNLSYFVTYLRFLRDCYILTEPLAIDGKSNDKIASIATALIEYDSYNTCKSKYLKEGSQDIDEELMAQYKRERAYHWGHFWQIVADNVQEWTNKNVAIQ